MKRDLPTRNDPTRNDRAARPSMAVPPASTLRGGSSTSSSRRGVPGRGSPRRGGSGVGGPLLAAGAFARAACWFLALAVVGVTAAAPVRAADAKKPHDHQGKVKPFRVPPSEFSLTDAERADLAAGKAVRKTLRGEGGGRGLAVIDVAAPPEVVWARIIDYPNYPKMVDNVAETEVYAREGDHLKVRFVLKGAGVSVEYFVDHVYRPKEGYLTWTLDYSKSSDLDDSVGFWRVAPHPERPGHSRVYYSIELRVGWWLPGFIENMLAKDGLVKSTEWVKREAEKHIAVGKSR